MVGARGLEYWVQVTTLSTSLRFPEGTEPAPIRTKVQDLAEDRPHPGVRYRLLSVPLDFGADFSGSLADLLADQLGTYDPVRWRAYWYDPLAEANLELSSAAPQFRPEPGRSFWLITRDPHRVDTNPVDGFSTRTDREYAIVLAPGWNLFGNPFAFPVAWQDVRRDTSAVGEPVAFDSGLGAIGDYADRPPALLEPFEGYFIHASGAETLWVSPRAASTVSAAAHSARGESSENPSRYRIRASTEKALDGANEFGVGWNDEPGFDPRKWLEPPPPPGAWVRVAFVRPGEAEALRRDLRAAGAPGERWEIEVRSGSPGELVTLEMAEILPASSGVILRILDRQTGELIEPRSKDAKGSAGEPVLWQYRLVSLGARPYRLAIMAGSEEYVAHEVQQALLVPARIVLEANAPNPFAEATRIRFGLPDPGVASLEIFSVLGQRIATPLDRKPFAAGYHAVVWDGRTASGRPAPAGVYLMRLGVGPQTLTRRLIRAH
jgi:hypothetical protein